MTTPADEPTVFNAAAFPFGPGCPATMPETVDDLQAWEPAAALRYITMSDKVNDWASRRTMPILAAVTEYLGQRRREVAAYDPEKALGPLPQIGPGAAANILMLRDVDDLYGFWHLGQVLMWENTIEEATEVLRCWRAGYTRPLVSALAQREMPYLFADTWVTTFPLDDLYLLLDAGYTAGEIDAVVASKTYPDRDMLDVLRALLGTPSHVA